MQGFLYIINKRGPKTVPCGTPTAVTVNSISSKFSISIVASGLCLSVYQSSYLSPHIPPRSIRQQPPYIRIDTVPYSFISRPL